MARKGNGDDSGSRSSLWDLEVDGEAPKSVRQPSPGKGPPPVRPAIIAGTGCVAMLLVGVCLVLLTAFLTRDELAESWTFHSKLSAVNRRAAALGGGVSNGRRAFRRHVGAWFHGEEIDDHAMLEIVSIVRDCQARGLGGAHLGLDLSRSGVSDEGIKLLHAVSGLELISVRDSKVTRQGVEALRRALPGTDIDAWPF